MNTKIVRIVNLSNNPLPTYATSQSAGMDLRANINEGVCLQPGERTLIPTGIRISLPEGYEAQIRPRSGLALKRGITVLNSPGTIDADFVGEIGVILMNCGTEPFVVSHGDRIAQMVVAPYTQVEWQEVGILQETERGDGGFGHSGVQ